MKFRLFGKSFGCDFSHCSEFLDFSKSCVPESSDVGNFSKVEISDAISGNFTRLRFSDIHNPSLRFLHRCMSFTLVPMAELCSIATPELKCLFAMVNRIRYTHVANIVNYFKNVNKISRPIECTSMVTWIATNLGCLKMANLAYIEGDVPIPGLHHFVHMHILCEEPNHSLSMLYGLTLQFDRMGEAHRCFTGPPHTHGQAHMEATQQTTTTPQAHTQEPQWDTRYGVATRVTMRVVVTTPLTVTWSLASKPKPPSLLGTLTATLLCSGTLVMGLTRLSTRWKGSDDSSIRWMTLHTCKRRCKPLSTHRPA
jgi:hypothetical protein